MSRRDGPEGAVLALDTSTDNCGVAVVRRGRVLYEVSLPAARRHSEVLHPAIAGAFSRLGWDPAASGPRLGGIGVTVGPGSFTGLRIGIAAAIGLAGAWGLAVAPLSSLAVLAAAAFALRPPAERDGGGVAAAAGIATRTGDCYAGLFVPGPGPGRVRQCGEVIVERPDAAFERLCRAAGDRCPTMLLSGGAWRSLDAPPPLGGQDVFDCGIAYPPPAVLARMSSESLERGDGIAAESVRPVYVRRSGAS